MYYKINIFTANIGPLIHSSKAVLKYIVCNSVKQNYDNEKWPGFLIGRERQSYHVPTYIIYIYLDHKKNMSQMLIFCLVTCEEILYKVKICLYGYYFFFDWHT